MTGCGFVTAARGGMLHAIVPGAAVGDGIRATGANVSLRGVVTALRDRTAVIAPHGAIDGIAVGDGVQIDPSVLAVPLGIALLGRAVTAEGEPLDALPTPRARMQRVAYVSPAVAERIEIAEPLWTGIRAIDGLLTIGRGARIGIFGAPGAGKSTLLETLARNAHVDAVVAALIGERGREAEEWMRRLGPRLAVVCATSDRSAAERVRAAQVAMAQAASLRARGLHVLVILDSLARYAAALREIGAASGESVGRGGYPPSVFAQLARLVEIAGPTRSGSVTFVASVLSDGDARDPVSDAARSLLDGHVELSVALAHAGHYPAIDVLESASRTMRAVVECRHAQNAVQIRSALACLRRTADARALGLPIAEPAVLCAAAAESDINGFLRQGTASEPPAATLSALAALADRLR